MNPTSNNTPPIICGGLKDIRYPVKELSPLPSPLSQIHSQSNSPLLQEIKEIKISDNDKALFERKEDFKKPTQRVSLLKF